MDGSGRWARQRHMPRVAGHRAGVGRVRSLVESCGHHGVEALTLFAFSTENWRRPRAEVGALMELFMQALKREVRELHRNNVRLRVIGDREALSSALQQRIAEAEELTAGNGGLALNVAANYGGRWDLAQASRDMAREVAAGRLDPESVDADEIGSRLALADLPEPDLFIRTGGEQRVSNFLLWQLAYAELYFTDTLWPDFDEAALEQALDSFRGRQRRFGQTGEQVEQTGTSECLENASSPR
jgi:undecaprenyl diphosphate synthase